MGQRRQCAPCCLAAVAASARCRGSPPNGEPANSRTAARARDDPSRWWHFRRRPSGRFATPKNQGRHQAALPGASIRVAHSVRPHPAVRTGQGPWRETRDAGCVGSPGRTGRPSSQAPQFRCCPSGLLSTSSIGRDSTRISQMTASRGDAGARIGYERQRFRSHRGGRRMDEATGEAEGSGLRVAFDRRLKLEFHGATVTSDAGLLAFRELDDALGLTAMAAEVLADPRTGRNGRHSLIAQLRQSVFGRLAGYEDVNDADRLGRDAAMRWVVGGRAVTEHAASTSQMGRFETSAMTSPTNLTALADLSGRWIDGVQARRAATALVLHIDSSVSPTYGAQEGTAYNGHFACTCYHPLFVFNQDGDLERCALRPGNVHSAHGWREVLDPVVARYRGVAVRRLLRGDAAFALPDV